MRYLICILLLVMVMPVYAKEEDVASLTQPENWLNQLDTATAEFQQIDALGHVMRGTFYIDRPGRLRFEYDEPTKDFIVADGVQIHFYDGEADQFNSAPIGMTLADFILRDDLSFADEKIQIESVQTNEKSQEITISQADEAGMGTLTLKFDTTNGYRLSSWDIVDAQGLTTTTILSNLKVDAPIPPSLFTVHNRHLNE